MKDYTTYYKLIQLSENSLEFILFLRIKNLINSLQVSVLLILWAKLHL